MPATLEACTVNHIDAYIYIIHREREGEREQETETEREGERERETETDRQRQKEREGACTVDNIDADIECLQLITQMYIYIERERVLAQLITQMYIYRVLAQLIT